MKKYFIASILFCFSVSGASSAVLNTADWDNITADKIERLVNAVDDASARNEAENTQNNVETVKTSGAENAAAGRGKDAFPAISERDAVEELFRIYREGAVEVNREKFLLGRVENANVTDQDGNTLLMWAVRKRGDTAVRMLIKAGADVNTRDRNGNTPLEVAISRSDARTAGLLILAGADVNTRDRNGNTLLEVAISRSDARTAGLLIIAGADVNTRDRNGNTLLEVAINKGNLSAVGILLNAGAKVTADTFKLAERKNNANIMAVLERADFAAQDKLISAIQSRRGVERLKPLIDATGNLNAVDKSGMTPLKWAVDNNDAPAVDMLIKAGADKNFRTRGVTPLIRAIPKNKDLAFNALIRAGADVNYPDLNDRTPLMWAVQNTANPYLTESLLKAGAKVNAADQDGETPLMWAATKRDNTGIIEMLIKRGANVNARDKQDRTPLIRAVESNSGTNVVKKLIERGALVNVRDRNGNTPLIIAAEKGNRTVYSILEEAGANKYVKKSGKTALSMQEESCRKTGKNCNRGVRAVSRARK